MKKTLAERFWPKVTKSDGCWEWNANRYSNGYGSMGLGGRGAGMGLAHRISWELHNGPIPGGLRVLHACDNRGCVRPGHLFLGTQKDNVDDMMAKGRHGYTAHRGERNGSAKLTADQVAAIRRLHLMGESVAAIAAAARVSVPLIQKIVGGRLWKYPDAGYEEKP